MKTIKFAEGVRVTVDGKSTEYTNGFKEAFESVGITDKTIQELAVRELICFHSWDISQAYNGHTVILEMIPVKD